MDDETQQVYLEGTHATRLVASEDWQWAKIKLEKLMEAIMSLETLADYKTATILQREIDARKKAKAIVKSWIDEVEGTDAQAKYNKQLINLQDDYIVREQ